MNIPFTTQCIHQTDYRARYPEKQDAGCFVATIRHCVERHFEQAFTMNQWSMLWKRALEEGAIAKSGFIQDHEWVGNIALDIIGQWDAGYRFIYVSIEEPREKSVRVMAEEHRDHVNHRAAVWETDAGMHMNYLSPSEDTILFDPYPGLNLKRLQTIRNYCIGRM